MSIPSTPSTASSQFTYRDLHLLSQYSPVSPLRVIALVDYDAFYAQCESVRLNLPATQPLAVQQWNDIIAVNYAAKSSGFKRGGSADEAKRACPGIILQHVATWREGEASWAYRKDATDPLNMKSDKAALDPYRIQSRKTFELVKSSLPPAPLQRIEKAGIDEFFLDLSSQVHSILLSRYPELFVTNEDPERKLPLPPIKPLDWTTSCNLIDAEEVDETNVVDWDDITLHIGSELVQNLRKVILEGMKYTCSAGIAHNKALAKLAAGYKKPNQQTVVRTRAISSFLSTYKMTSIRGLAGKLGVKAVEAFGAEKITKLMHVPVERMISELGFESGTWLFDIIRGKENSEVTPRTDIQSMLSQKTFAPPLQDAEQASNWLRIFAADLVGRINDLEVETGHQRRPSVIALHHHIRGRFGPTRSRQTTIPRGSEFNENTLFSMSSQLLQQISHDGPPTWPCLAIGLSVHKFEALVTRNERITSFFVKKSGPEDRKRKRSDSPNIEEEKVVNDVSAINSEEQAKIHATNAFRSNIPANHFSKPVENSTMSEYKCPKCFDNVADPLVLEHLDWHVALELQNDFS